jgi:D-alanine-D-alanine ligase-like ATP-grasp enzyme
LGSEPEVLPIIEQKFDFLPKSFHKIAGYELKWLFEDNLKDLRDAYDCPAKLNKNQEREIKKTSLKIFKTLGAYDCARIDYRMDQKGKLYLKDFKYLTTANEAKQPKIHPQPNVWNWKEKGSNWLCRS